MSVDPGLTLIDMRNPPQVCPLHGLFMLNILIAAILTFAQDETMTGLLPPSCAV
jgi:hypothetical protein